MEDKEKKRKSGNRNKDAGHGFERFIAKRLRDIGFEHVVTTRSESRGRDAAGIDLMNKDELKNGRLPYNIQCKNTAKPVKYHDILVAMPDDSDAINVIIHKFTGKHGEHFHPKGHYAILKMEDFLAIIKRLNTIYL